MTAAGPPLWPHAPSSENIQTQNWHSLIIFLQ
jgi:hypothetical protein